MKRFSKPFRSLLLAFLGAVVVLSWAISQGASNGSPPDPAPSPIPTHTPSRIPSQTPTVTQTPTLTSTPTHTATATPTQTATPTSPRTATIPRTGPVEQEPTSTALARSNDRPAAGFIPTYGYRIINTYPHDPEAFTQGLVFEAGVLYEGTGLQRRSTLRRVELETGEVLQLHTLPDEYFGEGITIYGDEIIQLTWQSHIGFVYDKDSFVQTGTFSYTTEGWGITHDGTHLIMSDGTPRLHFWDPETFEEVYWIEVHDSQGLVTRLNELEYIQGEIYANVWWTNLIAIIDPQTGQVTGWIDLTGLLSPEDYGGTVDVLNGIAYDAENDRLFVTGKLWPKLFEIELIPLPPQYVFLPFVGR